MVVLGLRLSLGKKFENFGTFSSYVWAWIAKMGWDVLEYNIDMYF